MDYHESVLKDEVLASFRGEDLCYFVDGTVGAGGHASTLLQDHPEIKGYIGIDQDPDALNLAKEKLEPWMDKVHLFKGNFIEMEQFLKVLGLDKVNGILLDLGVSSMQLDRPEKGFSFMSDGPLDMRMSPDNKLTAQEIVNTWSEEDLCRIFREYGEEKMWRRAAKKVVEERKTMTITTTNQLVEILKPLLFKKKKNIHPLTLIFQALRIAVNRELDLLEQILPVALQKLEKGGRLAVITFHSLEDRIVKNFIRHEASDKEDSSGLAGLFLSKEPTLIPINRKPIIATTEECKRNPRSRSAKLRVAEKI